MSYKKNLIKANGFPTLYGYECGNGAAEIVTQPNGEIRIVRLTPFCNGFDVKGNGVWERYYYNAFPSRSLCARKAESAWKRLVKDVRKGLR